MGFLDAVGPAADAAVARLRLADDDPAALQHRELMARALTLVGAWVRNERTGGPDRLPDDDLATAHGWVRHLAARQSPAARSSAATTCSRRRTRRSR
ncbi:hypothetical protein QP157_17035 [Sphingomonas sp. LR61]|uniref:hypothetical protein n=1 Tax=Sphingomonas sp. LR61 TaxID=3050234 RepID=UPI002FE14D30